jgi:competence protein ComEC
MVMDAGGWPTPYFDPGEAYGSAYLWHLGATHLQRLIISHPQRDHMAGAARLLDNFPTRELWMASLAPGEHLSPGLDDLIATAHRRGTKVRILSAPFQQTVGAGRLEVLHPWPADDDPIRPLTGNNRSLVVALHWGAHRFLWPGDVERKSEKRLVKRNMLHPVTLLLAPHHGSRSSSTWPFVNATRPAHVVFSVDAHNHWRMPHPEVVARWRVQGAWTWNTGRDGTLLFESDGRRLWMQPVPLPWRAVPDRPGH